MKPSPTEQDKKYWVFQNVPSGKNNSCYPVSVEALVMLGTPSFHFCHLAVMGPNLSFRLGMFSNSF
jgi:hypothetical protein